MTQVNIRPLASPSASTKFVLNLIGTYRPKKELLPVFQEWLESPRCLGGLGAVRAMDGFDESLKDMKNKRKEIKAEARGKKGKSGAARPEVMAQVNSSLSSGVGRRIGRSGSVSSSDIDELVHQARQTQKETEEAENKEASHPAAEAENKTGEQEATPASN